MDSLSTLESLILHAQAGFLFQREFLWGLSLIHGFTHLRCSGTIRCFRDKGGLCELGIFSHLSCINLPLWVVTQDFRYGARSCVWAQVPSAKKSYPSFFWRISTADAKTVKKVNKCKNISRRARMGIVLSKACGYRNVLVISFHDQTDLLVMSWQAFCRWFCGWGLHYTCHIVGNFPS